MRLAQELTVKANKLRENGLCPSFLNLNFKKYTFWHFLNDIFVGLKSFLLIIPLAIVFAMFSGGSPIQGLISVCIATAVSVFIGGSKFQINSVAWIVSVISIEVFTKYQYKGMLITSLMVAFILVICGRIGLGELLKHTPKTFLTAISICISLIIIVTQFQVLLSIPITYPCYNFNGNCIALFWGLKSVNSTSLFLCLIFIGSLAFLKIFLKNFNAYIVYIAVWGLIMWSNKNGIFTLPDTISSIETIGQSFFQDLNRETILNMSSSTPFSQSVYADLTLTAFSIALVIGCQVCSSVGASECFTGDVRIQSNMELISVGIANFLSVASGGLFISSDTDITTKNIKNRSKSIITLITIFFATYELLCLKNYVFQYIPAFAVSATLVHMSFHLIHQSVSAKYFNFKSSESQIFFLILFIAIEFSLVSAINIGIIISLMQFTDRLVKIKETSVHSIRRYDTDIIEFVANKYGYISSNHIPKSFLDKVEVLHLDGILSISQLERISDTFISRREFPSVVIVYFKNIPFFDSYAFDVLKRFVEFSEKNHTAVLVTGTNGLLLEILKNKSKEYNSSNVFGHVVPNVTEAIRQTLYRFNHGVQQRNSEKFVHYFAKKKYKKTAN